MLRCVALLPILLLAACGDDPEPEARPPRDPQVAQALNDPLMTDPDLSSRNEGAAALTVESDFSLPVLPATPEEIARARAEAAEIAGGAEKLVSPDEAEGATGEPFAAFLPAACGKAMQASAIWAAKLPERMPVYPRGHTAFASGSDAKDCKARIVGFATPVPVDDVMAFYIRRTAQAKIAARYLTAGDEVALQGSGKGLRYEVRARAEGDQTLVRIATLQQ